MSEHDNDGHSIREQLVRELKDILPADPGRAIKGVDIARSLKHVLRTRGGGRVNARTIGYHLSLLSKEEHPILARVEGGHGYYLSPNRFARITQAEADRLRERSDLLGEFVGALGREQTIDLAFFERLSALRERAVALLAEQHTAMLALLLLACCALASCAGMAGGGSTPTVVVDVSEQRMWVDGTPYRVGTARRGVGNAPGSHKTPVGEMVVVEKWDEGDPRYEGGIRGKKLWLAGDCCPESRRIYIHRGKTSTPTSLGCVHLDEGDLARVFERVPVGAHVTIRP